MWVSNQVRPYEVEAGAADAMVDPLDPAAGGPLPGGEGHEPQADARIFDEICADFATIPVTGEQKVRVGIVGEIYVKFSSWATTTWSRFLLSEGWSLWSRPDRLYDLQDLQPSGRCRPVRRKVDQEGRLPRLYVPISRAARRIWGSRLWSAPAASRAPGTLRRPTQTHPTATWATATRWAKAGCSPLRCWS